MRWELAHRADPECLPLADRHYNRQKPGTPQFVPPGSCLVFKARRKCRGKVRAVWVTSWPLPQYTKHRWAGAWVNTMFRNERCGSAIDLIKEALAVTRWYWPDVPPLGLVTFIDPDEVKAKKDLGYTYLMAGFFRDGETEGGLPAFRITADTMPPAAPPFSRQGVLFGATA